MEPLRELNVPDDRFLQANLIRFASLLFNRMSDKYGGATTRNELVMLNYGFVCHARGDAISVTAAASSLNMPKSTVSRILTSMRAKGYGDQRNRTSHSGNRVSRKVIAGSAVAHDS